ncbi:MAG: hypothetical protein EA397_07315 [Deltaproteobacteria bacterium]|nr:MAG: hypothetical protein EA397_07315 [Deltaproteobacteria bacterium]
MKRWVVVVLLGLACGQDSGEVRIVAWGEEAATVGYRASQTDGWDITLDHFISAPARFALSDRARESEVEVVDTAWVIDWTEWPEPAPLDVRVLPAERYRVGFDMVVPSLEHGVVGQVDADVVALMHEQGWAHHLAGSATDGETTVTFAWGFDNPTRNTECRNGEDRTDGVAIPPDGVARAQVTMHIDHVFWNTLRTEESPLAFSAIALADADGDGDVTIEELAAVSVLEAGYETAGVQVDDLYAFIRYSLARASHFNGEGLCRVQAL